MTDKVNILATTILSKGWAKLSKIEFDYKRNDYKVEKQVREVYDRGDGATILLFNKKTKSVVLTRQFRMPAYLNGVKTGMIIETCAGMLDENNPEDCIKKEIEEETGYKIENVKKIFDCFMSPGACTEIIHFFIGEYDAENKISEGGGLASESEEIEVLEMPFSEAMVMIKNGEIKDAKTIMLLQYAAMNVF